jgi:predicted DNA-binding protein (UPF0251 family)
METLPNPALEGYRTAHEQNPDGSYGIRVMPADLEPHNPGSFGRIIERRSFKYEIPGTNMPDVGPYRQVVDLGKRRISKKMEEVYRLRHHDFEGLSEADAARAMNMKPDAVRRLMWEMCKIAPQLFPILAPAQARIWHLWHHEGMSISMIGEIMELSNNAVQKRLGRARKRLDYHKTLKERLKVMDPRKLEQLEIEAKF